jgi:hypothetical protein
MLELAEMRGAEITEDDAEARTNKTDDDSDKKLRPDLMLRP